MEMDDNQKRYINLLKNEPIKLCHWVGFTKMIDLHNEWIKSMVLSKDDETLLAHRGSYKTTAVSVAMGIDIVLLPNNTTLFMRKTDTDVTEIIAQIKKILLSDAMQFIAYQIYGYKLQIVKSNSFEISTNLVKRTSGTAQLLGIGKGSSLTGKHFDRIRTDDICNLKDRISRAERDHTKLIYQELENIKNKGGKITNTATPWHKDDAISTLMPNVKIYDCYSTGLMTREEVEDRRIKMTSSLFAANYELKHIASENALFSTSPHFVNLNDIEYKEINEEAELIYNGIAHIDAAYGGEDGSALTLFKKTDKGIFVLGKLRKKHIDDCLDEYLLIKKRYRCGTINVESNADKGYLRKEITRRGDKALEYHESMNKYIKISTYLKKYWSQLIFLGDTDPDYINEIMDYTEDAEHDDCPDSLATLLRKTDKVERKSLLI